MSESRGRVLLVTRNLPPVAGGMERLVGRVGDFLSARYETTVIGPAGARFSVPPARHLPVPLSPAVAFMGCTLAQAVRAGVFCRPRLCIAGSAVTAPAAAAAAWTGGARYAVFVHGLDLLAASRFPYRTTFLGAIRRADRVIANSANTRRLTLAAGVAGDRIVTLHPGATVPAALPDRAAAGRDFRSRFGLPPGPILLSVGRLTARKGLAEFVRLCLPAVVAEVPDVQFVVVGAAPVHALRHTQDAGASIRAAIADNGLAERVHLLGPLDETGLELAYSGADLNVFPVRDLPGDVEGFGMVALEAAAFGLPTVAFDVGGVADAVAEGRSGALVPADDYPAMARAILRLLSGGERGVTADACRAFAAGLSWERFGERLAALCDELLALRPHQASAP